jgi:hypothetical protein
MKDWKELKNENKKVCIAAYLSYLEKAKYKDSVRKQHRLCSLVHMGLGQEVNPDHAKSKKMSGIRIEFRTKPFTVNHQHLPSLTRRDSVFFVKKYQPLKNPWNLLSIKLTEKDTWFFKSAIYPDGFILRPGKRWIS